MLDYKQPRAIPGKGPGKSRKSRQQRPASPLKRRARSANSPLPKKRTGFRVDWAALRPRLPALLARLGFSALLVWLVAGLAVEGWHLWRSPLRHVDVSGNLHLSPGRVVAAAGLESGMGMHQVDPYQVAVRLTALPRVKRADVRRIFPGRIDISLQERLPVAVVVTGRNRQALIDGEGVVLSWQAAHKETVRKLPRIHRRLVEVPIGTRLDDPVLARALALARDGVMGAEGNSAIQITVDDSFAWVLTLPGRRHRVILPPQSPLPALTRYNALFPPSIGPGTYWKTLDMRLLDSQFGARIVIRE